MPCTNGRHKGDLRASIVKKYIVFYCVPIATPNKQSVLTRRINRVVYHLSVVGGSGTVTAYFYSTSSELIDNVLLNDPSVAPTLRVDANRLKTTTKRVTGVRLIFFDVVNPIVENLYITDVNVPPDANPICVKLVCKSAIRER